MMDLSKLRNYDINFTHRLLLVVICKKSVKVLDDFLTYCMRRENNNIPLNKLFRKNFNDLDV